MAPDTLRTIIVHCHKNGRPWSRLHIHYPQWPADPASRPPYDLATARQLLALTGELPGSSTACGSSWPSTAAP
jgi:hypothetical protein